VLKQFDSALLPIGFARRHATWSRQAHEGFHQLIGFQTSKWAPEFTINAGLIDLQAHAVMFPALSREFFKFEADAESCRVGHLLPDLRDVCWKLYDPKSIESGLDMTLAAVIPFLETLSSRDAMIQWLRGQTIQGQDRVSFSRPPRIRLLPMQRVCLAVLLALQGQEAESSEVLGSFVVAKNPNFARYATDVAQRLGPPPLT
jgi:hypothetical protein